MIGLPVADDRAIQFDEAMNTASIVLALSPADEATLREHTLDVARASWRHPCEFAEYVRRLAVDESMSLAGVRRKLDAFQHSPRHED